MFTMEGDTNTLPSTASVEVQQNKRQSLTNGTRPIQPTPWRNFGLRTLAAPYIATTQNSSHSQRSHSQNQAVERRLGHRNKRTQLSHTIRLLPWRTLPFTYQANPKRTHRRGRRPQQVRAERINKLSDASTHTSLSVTRASQEQGAIRDFGESNLPHRAHKMRKWTISSKDHKNKMHRYARQSMANDAPSAAPIENGNESATNTPPQAKSVRLRWGTLHHHVGINLPSHPTNGAPNPAAHEPTHISPQKGAAKALVEYRSDASNTDDEYYDFAEGGFY
jgi:hypothetical protein